MALFPFSLPWGPGGVGSYWSIEMTRAPLSFSFPPVDIVCAPRQGVFGAPSVRPEGLRTARLQGV